MRRFIITILFGLLFITWGVTRFVAGFNFDRYCEGYLKRAADANTIEMARNELAIALRYMEAHGLTSGSTAIVFPTPDEDVGFWYRNVKTSHEELVSLPATTTPLERTNVLMKLRETLLDTNSSGNVVTLPPGISLYPQNASYAFWGWGSLIFGCMALGFGIYLQNRPSPRRRFR